MLEMASGLVGADASESAGGGTDNDPSIITLRRGWRRGPGPIIFGAVDHVYIYVCACVCVGALEGYWQVYGSLLAHDIRSPDGGMAGWLEICGV